ncbi:MAG TPA: amino acid adenylation domain-containing protein, partial [Micromonosporaceae bacterium]|nr:amino acid adenylation domain-containing protein [Micromonosporaceae bacterium]
HVLVLVTHHVVADGWSFGLLFGELAACYAAGVDGVPASLPELAVQYGDFALWQRDRWEEGGYAQDERHWRDELGGAPTTLTLPADRPRPPRQSYRGGCLDVTVPPELAGELRRLARGSGATLFMTLLAVFATVLSRYTGQRDLLVGVPVAGRTRPETEHLVGLFMNTLALRVRLDGTPSFAELLARVRRGTAAALAHQELPFDRVVELLAPTRSLARSPVVQVMFGLEEMPAPGTAGGVRWTPSIVDNGTAKMDLTLTMTETGGELAGRLAYDADLFTPGWVERFAACLLTVARGVVADPTVRVHDVELLPVPLRERVLGEWGAGPVTAPAGDVAALLAGALHGPGDGGPASGAEPAVVATDATLSRAATARCAGHLAGLLRRHGVGPEVPVGLCLPRTAALIPALLGVWWAGGAYVPLDPAYPAERLRLMVADSGLRVLLTDASLAGLVAEVASAEVTVLTVDAAGWADRPADPAAGADGPAPAPLPSPLPVPPEALAYTIFTSGSTGRPKGVGVPRGAVDTLLRAFRSAVGLDASDRLVAVTTLSFDIAVLELLLPLVCGAQVVVADAATAGDGAALRQLLVDTRATAMQATPATWRMLDAAGGIPPGVRVRLCGGEALPAGLVPVLTAGGAEVWNVYGPTETTVWSAAGRVAPEAPVEVGPPIPGTRMYVLDPALRPVPPGVVGEVYLGGPGVARGYHGRAGMTAGRFLPDPFAGRPGARLYRTGDLARWRENGRLDLLGRADHQVKVRGFRIETGEVEAVLSRHQAVRQAVVTPHADVDGAGSAAGLVAYVVPTDPAQSPVDVAELRRHLRMHLPEYMIPSVFVTLPELPLTPNGKVDRNRLPTPAWGVDESSDHEPPQTPVQRRLAEIWSELLPLAGPIGIHDNFFTLGGHSLTATQMIARIRAAFGRQLRLRVLFEHSTIAELAALLEPAANGGGSGPAGGRSGGAELAPVAAPAPVASSATAEQLRGLADVDLDDLLQTLVPEDER